MAPARAASIAGLLAVVAGIVVLIVLAGTGKGPSWDAATPGAEGPELILDNVEVLEIRAEGQQYRLLSDHASYRVLSRRLSATGVALYVPGDAGNLAVRATEATWDLGAGKILLPRGGDAGNQTGWAASLSPAVVSLPDRLLTAPGNARVAGPGLTVSGKNLAWHWREGRITLDAPKTWVKPARAFQKKG